jgi:ammonium transporter, Amt family
VTPDSRSLMALPLILLIPLAMAGLTILNAGLTRSRSTAHIFLASLCAVCVAILVYTAIGFSLAGGPGYVVHAVGRDWNVIGNGRLFARSVEFDKPVGPFVLLLQLLSVGFASLIPVAGGAERWRIAAVCASTVLLAGITYPLFALWAQSGWLSQLGFIDSGGIASIQILGGVNALCIAWIIGPRQGKFTADGFPTAMPGHSAAFVVFGCLLALVGWFGWTTASITPDASAGGAILAAVNTVLAAAAGAIAALVGTRVRFGKPDASLTANGWVAGLVAISASALHVKPVAAMLIGFVVGGAIVFAIEIVELHMKIDDPTGAISVHAVGGVWGVMALSIFGNGQFLPQLLGVATLAGVVLPMSYGLNALLNRFVPYRVSPSSERQGMDLSELGAGAYPEFVIQREDLMRR